MENSFLVGYLIGYAVAFALVIWLILVPGLIAKKRNHPHATAITIVGIVGALFGLIGWFGALAWAYIEPSNADKALKKVKADPNVADEILKLKRLEDEGILTTDEYEMKKTQLLAA